LYSPSSLRQQVLAFWVSLLEASSALIVLQQQEFLVQSESLVGWWPAVVKPASSCFLSSGN